MTKTSALWLAETSTSNLYEFVQVFCASHSFWLLPHIISSTTYGIERSSPMLSITFCSFQWYCPVLTFKTDQKIIIQDMWALWIYTMAQVCFLVLWFFFFLVFLGRKCSTFIVDSYSLSVSQESATCWKNIQSSCALTPVTPTSPAATVTFCV